MTNIKKLIGIFLFLILVDQLSKYLVRHFDGFYICNSGISFGINLPEFLFWIFWISIVGFLIFSIYKKYYIQYTKYQILILAGAISNIIDRIFFNCVIDFIDLRIWPVFNLADAFISLGAIAIIIVILKFKPRKE